MMKEPIYLFHHIPKCGGTSMKRALGKWFRRKDDYRPPWAKGARLERFRLRPLALDRLKAGTVICGHFEVDGIHVHQRYPSVLTDSRYRLITFVRNPWDLRLSLLRHEVKHGRLSGNEPIEQLLFDRPNWLSRRFPCTDDDFEAALDRYFFIGISEHSQDDFDRLADRVGRPRIRLPHRNRSRPWSLPVTEELRERFNQVHHLDFEIYESCLNRRRNEL